MMLTRTPSLSERRPAAVKRAAEERRRSSRFRPAVELLEDRLVLSTIYALTATGNNLLRFDSASPNTTQSVAVTGLSTTGETLVGIDFRPATGQLFAVGVVDPTGANNSEGRLYQINPTNGVATQVGTTPFSITLVDGANPSPRQ